jgi:hypothetical protein
MKPSQAENVGVGLSTHKFKKIPRHLFYLNSEKYTGWLQIRERLERAWNFPNYGKTSYYSGTSNYGHSN